MNRLGGEGVGRTVGVLGHLAEGSVCANGQILRTRIVLSEFANRLGRERVRFADTGQLTRRPLSTLLTIIKTVRACTDIVVMPADRGLRWLLPVYLFLRQCFGFRVHYLVVGGWLPRFLYQQPEFIRHLRQCAGIYVQTKRMLHHLRELGLTNVSVLPNFRSFPLARRTSGKIGRPLRLVYLSRLLPEKGPEYAIRAVDEINLGAHRTHFVLDLWGPVQKGQEAWFSGLLTEASAAVRYRGILDPEAVAETLVDYDAMVFPTFYPGEAFPGVVVDALIAGIPIIASDWQDNAEVIRDGVTGLLFQSRNCEDLKAKLVWCLHNPDEMMRMKANAAASAGTFHVDRVIPRLLENMDLLPRATETGGRRTALAAGVAERK